MQNAVALGTFDGVHKGHLAVLQIPDNYKKIALIFRIPPKCVKRGVTELLLNPEEKIKKLKNMGFQVEVLDFNKMEKLTAKEFLEYVNRRFSPALISCGFNYRFGYGGEGDTVSLGEFCGEKGIILKVANPVTEDGKTISSSLIRKLLKSGDVAHANRLLGYDFSFVSKVLKGDGRGRTLGFPTINQRYPETLTPPKFGVYESEILIDGKIYKGITNIGVRPTFPSDFIISETFIMDFGGDLYGKDLRVSLKSFLRDEKKFSSAEELKIQVLKDIEKI